MSPSAPPAVDGCGLVAVLTDPGTIRTYLTGVGLAAEPPAIAPARHRSANWIWFKKPYPVLPSR